MAYTQPETDVFEEEIPGESKPLDVLAEHRKQVRQRKTRKEEVERSPFREATGWVAIVAAFSWLLMLISYDPNDPSFLHQTSKMVPDNYLGVIGANMAALFFQFMGFGNYILPLCAFYIGYLCVRKNQTKDWFFQGLGGCALVLTFLVFLGSFSSVQYKGVEVLPGGAMGMGLWRFFSGYLNAVGTYLLLIAISGMAILVTTQLTLGLVGQWCLRACRYLWRLVQRGYAWIYEKYENRNAERTKVKIATREFNRMEEEEQEKKRQIAARIKDRSKVTPSKKAAASSLEELVADELDQIEEFGIQTEDFQITAEPEIDYDAFAEPFEDEDRPVRIASRGQKHDPDVIPINPMKQPRRAGIIAESDSDFQNQYLPLFDKPSAAHKIDETELQVKARSLGEKFLEFNVNGEIVEIHPGPVVTTYEFRPSAGIKYSKITNLSDDLCLALGAESVRIDRMPGRSTVGIEVPNNKRELITFREMIESDAFQKNKSKLLLCLGKTIDGTPHAADLGKMPHLLIAGQTGSGKSVGINAMLCSLLIRNRPDETKLILIDPKMVEMGIYADIPHLLTPVVTDPLLASNALKWAVDEMERRYRLLAAHSVRNLEHFNDSVRAGTLTAHDNEEPLEPLPFIVVVIDEMADLMMVARGEVEESIARLAQKSRAIGIHLIVATQRPSVDIITGVIKSNLPSRLAYRVAQRNDSRIILDANGADQLLGKGDGLFLGPGTSRLVRIHAPFLSEKEVLDLVKYLKNQGEPDYDHKILQKGDGTAEFDFGGDIETGPPSGKGKKKAADPMYEKAARLVVLSGQASVSYLQRKMGLGYARAAKLVDMMEEDGIVGPSLGSKARDILVSSDFFD